MPDFSHLRSRLTAEDGLSIVEVAVTGLMVGLIALSLVGLDAAGRTSADQRSRAQAFGVAQADQERIKGLSADQIANLNQTRTVTLDGVAYTVTSTGQFLNSAANTASCTAGATAADYARISSTVDWAANRRADIVVESTITPRAGGSLVTRTIDQNANPLPNVRVNVAGADQSTDSVRRFGTTDSGGCVIFGTLLVGDYTVSPTLAGYVDPGGNSTPSQTVSTTAGNTTSVPFTLGQAGRVNATFETVIGASTLPGQQAPSISWFNSGMPAGVNGAFTPSSPATSIQSPMTLFPFFVGSPGNYNNNYNVWAGRCMGAQPPATPTGLRRTTSPGVSPGGTGTANVRMPALIVKVSGTSTTSGNTFTSRLRPDQVELRDACGQTWDPPLRTTDPDTGTAIAGTGTPPDTGYHAHGALSLPGQPYGTGYTVCADRDGYRSTVTGVTNTDWTAGTTVNVRIDFRSTANQGRC